MKKCLNLILLIILYLTSMVSITNAQSCGGGKRNPANDAFVFNTSGAPYGSDDVSADPTGTGRTAFVSDQFRSYGNPKGTTTGGTPLNTTYVAILDSNYNVVTGIAPMTNTLGGSAINGYRCKYLKNGGLCVTHQNGNQIAYLAPGATTWVYSANTLNTGSADPVQPIGGDSALVVSSTNFLAIYKASTNTIIPIKSSGSNIYIGFTAPNTHNGYAYWNGNVYYADFSGTNSNGGTDAYIKSVKLDGSTNSGFTPFKIMADNIMSMDVRPTDGQIFLTGQRAGSNAAIYASRGFNTTQAAANGSSFQDTHNRVYGDYNANTVVLNPDGTSSTKVMQKYLNLFSPFTWKSYFRFDKAGNIYFNNFNNDVTDGSHYATSLIKLNPDGSLDPDFMINQTDYADNNNPPSFSGFDIYKSGRIVTTGIGTGGTAFEFPCGRTNGSDKTLAVNAGAAGSTGAWVNSGTYAGNDVYNFSRGMMLFYNNGKLDGPCSATTDAAYVAANCSDSPVDSAVLDCSNIEVIKAPDSGKVSNLSIILPIYASKAGVIGSVSISGSGMSMESPVTLSATATGTQQYVVPVHYDGSPLTTATITVAGVGSCTINFATTPYNHKTKVCIDVLVPNNCIEKVAGPSIK